MGKMRNLNLIIVLICMFFAMTAGFATQEQVKIDIKEYVDQEVVFNPLKTGSGIWFDTNENQSKFNLTGYLIVSNSNPNGKTISDIYVSFDFTTNITLPINVDGRSGIFIANDTSSNNIILHIPELMTGENSTWIYSINSSNIRSPLNFTSTYTDSKVLAGQNTTVTDTLENVFDNVGYQTNTCLYDINITLNSNAY